VEVRIVPGDPAEICVTGIVEESVLFGPQFRLTTEIRLAIGSRTLRISDRIRNLRSTPSEMQMLYHCNFGTPLLAHGARLLLTSAATLPRDARAAEDACTWSTYSGPTPGFVEQCYWHIPLADADGRAIAMLVSADGNAGVALRYNTNQLPCFTQWKNTGAASDGYVTGLEPATSYPNAKPFERSQNRVVTLAPQEEYTIDLALEVCDTPEAVGTIANEIATIQADTPHTVHTAPDPAYSDCH
jgi:hypothetical protein